MTSNLASEDIAEHAVQLRKATKEKAKMKQSIDLREYYVLWGVLCLSIRPRLNVALLLRRN